MRYLFVTGFDIKTWLEFDQLTLLTKNERKKIKLPTPYRVVLSRIVAIVILTMRQGCQGFLEEEGLKVAGSSVDIVLMLGLSFSLLHLLLGSLRLRR